MRARVWSTRDRKKREGDKTEDTAREGEGEGEKEETGGREKDKSGMTTRIAPSYSLGYNSAVLGQCKLNESFSPRRPRLLVSHLLIPLLVAGAIVAPTPPTPRTAAGHAAL